MDERYADLVESLVVGRNEASKKLKADLLPIKSRHDSSNSRSVIEDRPRCRRRYTWKDRLGNSCRQTRDGLHLATPRFHRIGKAVQEENSGALALFDDGERGTVGLDRPVAHGMVPPRLPIHR